MNLAVQQIPSSEAEPWLLKRHYARRRCCITHAFGVYRGPSLIGVVTYGIPPSPHLCRGICGEDLSGSVLELNRLCCENTKNVASVLVGRSLRLLPKPTVVVSFADTGKDHVGFVYQATNFLYTGLTDAGRKSPRTDRISTGNHGRHESRIPGTDKVDTTIGILIPRSPKHRYVFFVGTSKQVKAMRSSLLYALEPYPKGESKRYDASAEVNTQMRLL